MALSLSKEQPSGLVCSYWRLLSVKLDAASQRAEVCLGLYKDKEARQAGKEPATWAHYEWSGDDYPFTVAAMDEANPVALAYAKLKALPEFEGAVDA